MRFSVEISTQERGLVKEGSGFLSGTNLDLKEILEWTKSQLILISDQVLKEEQGRGFDKNPIMLVDRKRGKSVRDVSPLGSIEFVARQSFVEVVVFAYESLLKLSKVLKGDYKSSHFVFHNGQEVARDLATLKKWASTVSLTDQDLVRIVNIQPYARRLETLGVTAKRSKPRVRDLRKRSKRLAGIKVRRPNGAYHLAQRQTRERYRDNVNIKMDFISGASLGIKGEFKTAGRRKNSLGRPYLYPTLIFTAKAGGTI